jgi:hypothetical protein
MVSSVVRPARAEAGWLAGWLAGCLPAAASGATAAVVAMAAEQPRMLRRLQRLCGHLTSSRSCPVKPAPQAASTAAAAPPPGPAVAGGPGLKPLSESQIEQFCRDGHLILHISEVPAEIHARIYEHARINQKGSVFTPGQLTAEGRMAEAALPDLTPEQRAMFRQDFASVAQSPTILGAMHSLLGPDFVGTVDELQGGPQERLLLSQQQDEHPSVRKRPVSLQHYSQAMISCQDRLGAEQYEN